MRYHIHASIPCLAGGIENRCSARNQQVNQDLGRGIKETMHHRHCCHSMFSVDIVSLYVYLFYLSFFTSPELFLCYVNCIHTVVAFRSTVATMWLSTE